MKVIIFGATGMVGQGVLRECLLATDVESVLTVGRNATGRQHEKLREVTHEDFTDFAPLEKDLTGYDACFFCMGASVVGIDEKHYTRITHDFTLAAATLLARLNPEMTFIYISGMGADNTEHGRIMWTRIKGKTENALLKLPFKAAYMFRPGYIQPMHGIVSRTPLYRILYAISAPLYPLWKVLFTGIVTTTEKVGKAMLNVSRNGAPKSLLENHDINTLSETDP